MTGIKSRTFYGSWWRKTDLRFCFTAPCKYCCLKGCILVVRVSILSVGYLLSTVLLRYDNIINIILRILHGCEKIWKIWFEWQEQYLNMDILNVVDKIHTATINFVQRFNTEKVVFKLKVSIYNNNK